MCGGLYNGELTMRNLKLSLATMALAICGAACGSSTASAQIQTYYSPGYAVPAYVPGPTVYAPPIVVARPIVVTPAPVQVVTAYRPIVPTYVAPAAVYSTYRSVVPTPIYRPTYTVPTYTVPTYTAPTYTARTYTAAAYRVPAYTPPAYGTVTRYRSGYVGPGVGGAPSLYTPGQPVRNALRFVVP